MKNIINEQLEQLLSSKSFVELTAEERYFVTETLHEEEYERMRLIIKNAPIALQSTPAPNPAIRENLLAAMQQMAAQPPTRKGHGTIIRLLNTRIPAWQAAAAIALLLGFHFLSPEKTKVELVTKTEYVHLTDTIFKEVAMPSASTSQEKPVVKSPGRINVKPNVPSPSDTLEPSLAMVEPTVNQAAANTEIPDTFALMVSQPRGQSARQTEELWQFLEEVY